MKKIINPRLTILILVTLVFNACKKTDPEPVPSNIADNTAPVANAGKDTTIIFPVTSVLLDGSASTDKENNIVSYSWRDLSSPSYYDIIGNKNSVKTLAQCYENRSYQFELTVTDRGGLSSKDTLVVSEVFPTPKPGDIKAGDDITLTLPYNRTGLGIISKIAYPYDEIVMNWKKVNGPGSITNSNLSSPFLTDLVEGVYQYELTVTYWNQFTDKDTMTVTVLPDNNVYTAEKLFERLVWVDQYPISTIIINDISSILASGQHFKVYLKKDINDDWQIVCPQLNDPYNLYYYYYSVDINDLKVFVNYDPSGWGDEDFGKYFLDPSIKIVY